MWSCCYFGEVWKGILFLAEDKIIKYKHRLYVYAANIKLYDQKIEYDWTWHSEEVQLQNQQQPYGFYLLLLSVFESLPCFYSTKKKKQCKLWGTYRIRY